MIDFTGAVYRGAIIEGRKEGLAEAFSRSVDALKKLGASQEFIEKYINLCNAKDDKNS